MVEVERREQKADDAANTIAVERDRLLVMRFFHVFNASQIDGIPALASPARTIEPVEAAECIMEA
jgi:antirestriction protein ArdC